MARQYRPFCICCTKLNGFQLYAVLFFHTLYKMIMSKFTAMALKAKSRQPLCTLFFMLSKVMQAVSLNDGKLADKQHTLVAKSRIIAFHDRLCCFPLYTSFPSATELTYLGLPAPWQCCVPTGESLSEIPAPVSFHMGSLLSRAKEKVKLFLFLTQNHATMEELYCLLYSQGWTALWV